MVDAAFGEVMVTCEKIAWLLREGERYLKPERRSPGVMVSQHTSTCPSLCRPRLVHSILTEQYRQEHLVAVAEGKRVLEPGRGLLSIMAALHAVCCRCCCALCCHSASKQ